MKIITWNCNGAFRKKLDRIINYKPDIFIIQECENFDIINKTPKKLNEFIENFYWIGENKNKGLGIFSRKGINLELLNWDSNYRARNLKWFLPVRVNNELNLLGVWTHHADAKAFSYIGQFWLYLQNNIEEFKNIIIAGDFNSNNIWDSWDRWWNHSDCVNELEKIKIYSVYHKINGIEQGKEKEPTFFLHKNTNKPYHIDYIFASKSFFSKNPKLKIEKFGDWKDFSDHAPLIFNF